MFTLPDGSDASTTLPAFKPPGPKPSGFWQDCDPGANFAGTIPLADYFNEVIVNLRALLVRAAVTGVKGDETMLWRAIEQRIHALDIPQQFFQIDAAVTLNVAPGGSPTPANPLGGQPFDNLASAWHWLSFYTITSTGSVTIQLAAATYSYSAPLVLDHANGDRISIVGADTATTVLSFSAGVSGVIVNGYLNALTNLTIVGGGGGVGLSVNGTCNVSSGIVQGFAVGIQAQGNGYFIGGTIAINNCSAFGLFCGSGGAANVNVLNCVNIAFGIGAPVFSAAVTCLAGGVVSADQVITQNCHKGAFISGGSTEFRVRIFHIGTIDGTTGIAAEANDGGTIISSGVLGGNPGEWHVDNPGYFYANTCGLIRADNSFDNWSFVSASPTPQIVGNANALVWTTNSLPPPL